MHFRNHAPVPSLPSFENENSSDLLGDESEESDKRLTFSLNKDSLTRNKDTFDIKENNARMGQRQELAIKPTNFEVESRRDALKELENEIVTGKVESIIDLIEDEEMEMEIHSPESLALKTIVNNPSEVNVSSGEYLAKEPKKRRIQKENLKSQGIINSFASLGQIFPSEIISKDLYLGERILSFSDDITTNMRPDVLDMGDKEQEYLNSEEEQCTLATSSMTNFIISGDKTLITANLDMNLPVTFPSSVMEKEDLSVCNLALLVVVPLCNHQYIQNFKT